MTDKGRQPTRAGRRPLTGAGLVACLVGVTLTGVAGIAAAAAWQHHVSVRQEEESATGRAEAAAVALSALTVRAIQADDLAGLQREATVLSRRLGAEVSTIELADGQVLFDLKGERQVVLEAPATWISLPAAGAGPMRSGVATERATVADRGDVLVQVAMPVAKTFEASAVALPAGLAGLCIAVSLGLLVRALRLARPLRQISGALAAAAKGERCADALAVNEGWGSAAEAWNALLAEREAIRGEILDELSTQVSGSSGADSLAQRACDTLPSGLILLDGVGNVRYGNGAAAMLLGVSREELLGGSLQELLSDPAAWEQIGTVLSGGSRRRAACESERFVGDNRSILRFTAVRMGHEEGDSVMLILDDVTQQRTADQARDAFVAQATHELRTPLTNMRLYLELLLEDEADEAEQERSLNVISQEARRLERMVGDMLSVAEIEAGSLKMHIDDVRLDQLLSELQQDYRAQAEEAQVTLTFDLPPKLPVISGDRDKIALCLHNLIANALKYTPAGGEVVVTAEDRDESFVVRVSDTGMGIAAEERERIFQKFYRSTDDRIATIPGTGLGLALARDVARLHGGDITVESEVNRGSTFTVSIPVRAKAA